MTEDDGSKIVVVKEVVAHIEDHYAAKPETPPVSKSGHGLFHRLTSGNMFLSQKKKCLNIVTKGIARGATSVPKSSLKGTNYTCLCNTMIRGFPLL